MDLRFTPEEIAFRQEVRDFIRDNLPADIHHRMKLGHSPTKEDTVRWQRILNAKGWAGLSWPKEWGGTGDAALLDLDGVVYIGPDAVPGVIPALNDVDRSGQMRLTYVTNNASRSAQSIAQHLCELGLRVLAAESLI